MGRGGGNRPGHGRFRNFFHGRGLVNNPVPAARPTEGAAVETRRVRAEVDPEKCTGCRLCAQICRFNAIDFTDDIAIINDNCIGCGMCVGECPGQAISLKESDAPV